MAAHRAAADLKLGGDPIEIEAASEPRRDVAFALREMESLTHSGAIDGARRIRFGDEDRNPWRAHAWHNRTEPRDRQHRQQQRRIANWKGASSKRFRIFGGLTNLFV